jgi:hypothetical protein
VVLWIVEAGVDLWFFVFLRFFKILVADIWLLDMDSTSLFDEACATTVSYRVYHILKG